VVSKGYRGYRSVLLSAIILLVFLFQLYFLMDFNMIQLFQQSCVITPNLCTWNKHGQPWHFVPKTHYYFMRTKQGNRYREGRLLCLNEGLSRNFKTHRTKNNYHSWKELVEISKNVKFGKDRSTNYKDMNFQKSNLWKLQRFSYKISISIIFLSYEFWNYVINPHSPIK